MTKNDASRKAVALAYGTGASAPTILAKGKGFIAEEIIARAKEHGIFVYESREMTNLLMKIDIDREIPPNLYKAIAELLAWVYHMERLQEGYIGLDG